MKVECGECHFSRIVRPDDVDLPGEIVIQHGEETGHGLSVSTLDEERDPLASS